MNLDKIRISEISSLQIGHFHVVDVTQHRCYQQIVALIYLTQVNKKQKYYILKDPVPLAEGPLFKHFENGFDKLIDFAKKVKQLCNFQCF
jgi:hypothetical protein